MEHKLNKRTKLFASAIGIGVMAVLSLCGCNREKISSYRIPKEDSSIAVRSMAPANLPHLHWELPEGWSEDAPEKMTVGKFHVLSDKGGRADITITPLPGVSGIELDSVNMWRSQLGMPPLKDVELSQIAE